MDGTYALPADRGTFTAIHDQFAMAEGHERPDSGDIYGNNILMSMSELNRDITPGDVRPSFPDAGRPGTNGSRPTGI